jgi:shikimate kinase
MKKKIFLIGYRATGKTEVGRRLAERLGWGFRDLDDWIESEAGITIEEMVKKYGWPFFRHREQQALRQALAIDRPIVVACGGGAVMHEDIWPEIMEQASVIWLRAGIETIVHRISSDPMTASRRPALVRGKSLEQEIETVLNARMPLYKKFSHIHIDTDLLTPDEITSRLVQEMS